MGQSTHMETDPFETIRWYEYAHRTELTRTEIIMKNVFTMTLRNVMLGVH